MSGTDTLSKIMALCRCGVHITINEHRDLYESVEYRMECNGDKDHTARHVLARMIETDTMVQVQCYPDTPIGSYTVCHYDIGVALDSMLETLEENRRENP